MPPTTTASLRQFTSRLIERYRELDRENPTLLSLIYANGLLLKAGQVERAAQLPLQVAVIGPTQVGKSSLVNLLLGADLAGVSALAGHTRHAQGFSRVALGDRSRQRIDELLPGLTPADPAQLQPDQAGYYSLIEVPGDSGASKLPPLLVWDSPDFDSVSSRSYRATVPALCALADLVVMVVSKEKYADLSVWELLRLIAPASVPLLLVANKVPEAAGEELLEIIAGKFEAEGLPVPPLFSLPYLDRPEQLAGGTAATRLLDGVASRVAALDRTRAPTLAPLLQRHWQAWTRPLREELAADRNWRDRVDAELREAELQFERDYLVNPSYREGLDQALLQLLQLLELPGLAAPLAKARELVTWPVRKAVALLRSDPVSREARRSAERRLLDEALRQARQRLLHQATVQSSRSKERQRLWWQQLWLLLQQSENEIGRFIEQQVRAHQQRFQPEIERAARQLYEHLQQHPATLNGLRATRATADAAAVAFALKTGGIGLTDLVFAPAMLAFSSLVAESAAGQYMDNIGKELKASQQRSLHEQLFLPLRQRLSALPAELPDDLLFGFDEAALQRAERALEALG